MAFDIKIVNGDILFDNQGRLELVREGSKVVQEVLKLISTSIGSDTYDPNYGVSLTEESIGVISSVTGFTTAAEAEIRRGIENLIAEQRILAQTQRLTSGERIDQINAVSVSQDSNDPRQYNVSIDLTTRSNEPITIDASIRA